jgi:hypothetical protein
VLRLALAAHGDGLSVIPVPLIPKPGDELRQRFTETWPHLAPAEREALWAIARREPLIASLPPASPLAQQALIRAYGAWCERR